MNKLHKIQLTKEKKSKGLFDGKVDISEYKVDDVDGETLPKIRVFREALGIKWIRSVLCALHLYLYFSGHTWSKIHIW